MWQEGKNKKRTIRQNETKRNERLAQDARSSTRQTEIDRYKGNTGTGKDEDVVDDNRRRSSDETVAQGPFGIKAVDVDDEEEISQKIHENSSSSFLPLSSRRYAVIRFGINFISVVKNIRNQNPINIYQLVTLLIIHFEFPRTTEGGERERERERETIQRETNWMKSTRSKVFTGFDSIRFDLRRFRFLFDSTLLLHERGSIETECGLWPTGRGYPLSSKKKVKRRENQWKVDERKE